MQNLFRIYYVLFALIKTLFTNIALEYIAIRIILHLHIIIWYALQSQLTVTARIGCGLRKEKVVDERYYRSENK